MAQHFYICNFNIIISFEANNMLLKTIKQITAEPALLLYVIAFDLHSTISNALWYHKVCFSIYHNNGICERIAENTTLNIPVQEETSRWQFYSSLTFNIPALVSVFLFGHLSDHYRRKVPILLPCIGNAIESLVFLLGSLYLESHQGFLLIGSFCAGVGGGLSTILMGTVSYISDISLPEKRTFRISLMYGCSSVASLISYTCSGVLFEATGFLLVYTLCLTIYNIAILYIVLIMPDIKAKSGNENVGDEAHNTTARMKRTLADILQAAKQVLILPFKYRTNNARMQICVLIGIILGELLGSASRLNYLFLTLCPLCFTQTMYGFYSGFAYLMRSICLFFVVPLLKTLRVKETNLLLACIVSFMMQQTLTGLSKQPWLPFVATMLGLLSGSTFVCIRGILSQLVSNRELGRIFALMAVVENLGSLLASALYSYFLYPLTVEWFAGFCYLFAACVLTVPAGLTIWLHVDLKKHGFFSAVPVDDDLERLEEDFGDLAEAISLDLGYVHDNSVSINSTTVIAEHDIKY